MPIQIYRKFQLQKKKKKKNCKFSDENSDTFNISAQNIDCGYSLEQPRWDGSNEYLQSVYSSKKKIYLCKPKFYYIQEGFKEIKIM